MHNTLRLGAILIVVGLAGLIVLGMLGGDGAYGPWHHGPMMRGFGRHPMFGYPGPRGGPQALPPVAGARTVEVAATDFAFRPAELTLKVGEVVTLQLVNQGIATHDLVMPSLGIWLVVAPGQSQTSGVRFDRPGEYEFFCSVPGHREAGMIGRVVVTP